MAEPITSQAEYQRVPILDASTLEGRTRPAKPEPFTTWYGRRLSRRGSSGSSSLRRARAWLQGLAGPGIR